MGGRPSLPSDTTISLTGRGYTSIPLHVSERHPVVSLGLAGNRLQALPKNLRKLKYIILDGNGYTRIPKKVEEAENA